MMKMSRLHAQSKFKFTHNSSFPKIFPPVDWLVVSDLELSSAFLWRYLLRNSEFKSIEKKSSRVMPSGPTMNDEVNLSENNSLNFSYPFVLLRWLLLTSIATRF